MKASRVNFSGVWTVASESSCTQTANEIQRLEDPHSFLCRSTGSHSCENITASALKKLELDDMWLIFVFSIPVFRCRAFKSSSVPCQCGKQIDEPKVKEKLACVPQNTGPGWSSLCHFFPHTLHATQKVFLMFAVTTVIHLTFIVKKVSEQRKTSSVFSRSILVYLTCHLELRLRTVAQ